MGHIRFFYFVLSLLSSFYISGCATMQLTAQLPTDAQLKPLLQASQKIEKKYPALLLQKHNTFVYELMGDRMVYQRRLNLSYLVLSEAGFGLGRLELPMQHSHLEITSLLARSINTDGTSHTITETDLIKDTITSGGETRLIYYAQIPRVSVGTRIDLSYVMTYNGDGYFLRTSDNIFSSSPTLQYKTDLYIDKKIRFDLMLRNKNPPLNLTHEGKMQHVTFSVERVDPVPDEDFAPPDELDHPWWMLRFIDLQRGAQKYPLESSWDSVVRNAFYPFYHSSSDLFDALPRLPMEDLAVCEIFSQPGTADPSDEDKTNPERRKYKSRRLCLIERALLFVRTHSSNESSFGSMYIDPFALQSQDESLRPIESAALLWHLLSEVGLRPKLATAVQKQSNFDDTFPSMQWFDFALIRVDDDQGNPIWIVPTCETCRVGELPSYADGVSALVMQMKRGDSPENVSASWEKTTTRSDLFAKTNGPLSATGPTTSPATGPTAVPHTAANYFTDWHHDLQLDDDGSATGTLTRTWFGRASGEIRSNLAQYKSSKDRVSSLQKRLQNLIPQLIVDEAEMPSCDRSKSICTQRAKYTIPKFAHREGNSLVFDLRLLFERDAWNDIIPPLPSNRFFGVAFASPRESRRQVAVTLPKDQKNWHLHTPVVNQQWNTTRVSCEKSVETTTKEGHLQIQWSETIRMHAGTTPRKDLDSALAPLRSCADDSRLLIRVTQE